MVQGLVGFVRRNSCAVVRAWPHCFGRPYASARLNIASARPSFDVGIVANAAVASGKRRAFAAAIARRPCVSGVALVAKREKTSVYASYASLYRLVAYSFSARPNPSAAFADTVLDFRRVIAVAASPTSVAAGA